MTGCYRVMVRSGPVVDDSGVPDSEEGSGAVAMTSDAPDGQNRPAGTAGQQPPPSPGDPNAPQGSGTDSWYRRGWVIGLVALLVGAGAGVGIGVAAGSNTTTRFKTTTVAGPTRTVTKVHTVPG